MSVIKRGTDRPFNSSFTVFNNSYDFKTCRLYFLYFNGRTFTAPMIFADFPFYDDLLGVEKSSPIICVLLS